MSTIDRTYTFDMANQPGISNEPISRSMLVKAVEALGLDPLNVLELHVEPDSITVTATLRTIDGGRVLGAPDAFAPDGEESGFLKHTYTVRICTDDEADRINRFRDGEED